MWVTTKVTYDGQPERTDLSIKRGVKTTFRAFLYVCVALGLMVALFQVVTGGMIEEFPPEPVTRPSFEATLVP